MTDAFNPAEVTEQRSSRHMMTDARFTGDPPDVYCRNDRAGLNALSLLILICLTNN